MIDQLLENYFFFVFTTAWLGVSFVLSKIGGWADLVQDYRSDGSEEGEKWRFRNVSMKGTVFYSGCVFFTSNRSGLGLSILFPFRFGHPPLFVPWSDISIEESTRRGRPVINFFVSHLEVPLCVGESLGKQILTAGRVRVRD